MPSSVAAAASAKVLTTAGATSSSTGRRVTVDWPKSPVSTWPSHFRYCSGSERSKP